MKKILFLVLIFNSLLYSQINKPIKVGAFKAWLVTKNILKVRTIFRSQSKTFDSKKPYIRNISIKFGNKTIYDVTVNDSLAKRQDISFFTLDKSDISHMTLVCTYNTGEKESFRTKIRRSHYKSVPQGSITGTIKKENRVDNSFNLEPAVWKAQTIDEAIKLIYGDVQIIESDTESLNIIGTSTVVVDKFIGSKFNFFSKKDIESIVILSTGSKNVVQAVFKLMDKERVGISDKSSEDIQKMRLISSKIKKYRLGNVSFTSPSFNFSENETIEIITQTRQGKVYRQKLTTEHINWSFTNHYLEL